MEGIPEGEVKDMTRILVVTEQNWPEGGGGTLATHLIAGILAQEGFRVKVATGTKRPRQLQGIEYIVLPHLRAHNKMRLWFNLALLGKSVSLRKLVENADAVYIPRYCYPIIPLAKSLGKKVVVHLHDYQPISHNATVMRSRVDEPNRNLDSVSENVRYELAEHGSMSRAMASTFFLPLHRFVRNWLRGADEVICVSERQATIMGRHLRRRTRVIYNPLPAIPFVEKRGNSPRFLYIGGTSPMKGMNTFVEACGELLKRHGDARILVTKGDPVMWKRAFSGIPEESYQILGWVDHSEMSRLHTSTKGLIFPSLCEEPLPYAVSEAMLHGTIPIASRVGGVPEIVGGSFAERMMFRPGDSIELLERMETILNMSNAQISGLASALRDSVMEKFDAQIIRRKFVQLFQNCETTRSENENQSN